MEREERKRGSPSLLIKQLAYWKKGRKRKEQEKNDNTKIEY